MTEATGAPAAQGAAGTQAQGVTSPAQGAQPQSAQGASGEGGEDAVETLRQKLADLEKDNRAYRQREAQREAAEKEKAQAEQTESERLAERIADLERQLTDRVRREQEQSLRLASITAAQKLGYRNPDLAYRLIDSAAVQYGEDGLPRNVEQMLTALAKSDPYLLTQTDFGGGPRGGSAAQGTDMNALIRKAAGR